MATRLDAITEGYTLVTGKTTLPAVGTVKRNLLTSFAIKFYRDWQTEPGVEWESLYSDVEAGTATAGQDTYELDTDINFISKAEGNNVRILVSDDNYIDFTTVKPQQLYQYRNTNAVAKVADNSVKFSKAFEEDTQEIGGTIIVPAIIKLDDINADTDDILIDDPNWLSVRIAAQYAYSFKSLRNMYPDLLDQANELMLGMKMRNEPVSSSYNTGVDYMTIGADE